MSDLSRSISLTPQLLIQPSRSRRFGSHVFVGGVLPVDVAGKLIGADDIEAQTHAVFRNLKAALEQAGLQMADLVRLNTYYVFDGEEDQATVYWEKMTRVRLQYFPDPGPAATAVRVRGMGCSGALIQLEVEALAVPLAQRQRIMPKKSWDWSIPVPLSQGWKSGSQVWVGGQVSADMSGKAVALDDLYAQTHNVLEHIRHVLQDAGACLCDLAQLKICYLHEGDDNAAQARLEEILSVVRETCGAPLPPVTAFGVNLLYQGLLLEIDATALVGESSQPVLGEGGGRGWAGCAPVRRNAASIHVAGQSVQHEALEHACSEVLARIVEHLRKVGSGPQALAHLHVLVAGREADLQPERATTLFAEALRGLCGDELPPFTVVRVNGLPGGASLQVDAVAVDLDTPARLASNARSI
ncbi:RidA family protein [Pseudomonas auratipiscis]|uniref:RidA family protein n=1 Tax=Pseudomonas auratipiscis TaxID=3115853 RepID=A0AB35WUN8_9PSED|nr:MULTISPECIES: RidA family protein [unclassified Pseudomonas]MEE1866795.1 RidA family protein [Pseudomonas sp. 120P]MEE1958691.1 RidA family protein [Pseudomonas sp. 119P]